MTKPATTSVVYVGPAPEVVSGVHVFPNGEPVEVPADLADSLLQQDTFTTHKNDAAKDES